uniref:IRG-type G domain-containing protein n=1 Tax=Esox lucius TaxID=8010 RepID=A0AAY5KDQ1_ESOLU
MFSDESKFCISFGNQGPRVWKKRGEAQNTHYLKSSVKFPQSVMVWGAMSSAGVGPLCFLRSKNTDQGASPTGVTETTIDVLGFPYPELPNVWLWDLPGMGRVGDLVPNDDKLPSIQPPTLPLSFLESVQLLQILSAQGRSCYLVISKADLIDEVAVEEVRRWSEETLCRIGLKQTTFLEQICQP